MPVNNLRYKIYRASGRVISGDVFDNLKQHIKRASYQVAVWKRFLEWNPTIIDPVGRGWSEVENVICIV